MNLSILTSFSFIIFILVFFSMIFAFTKSQASIRKWSILVILFFGAMVSSWFMKDLSGQWVLIEAGTLIGSLLISMSQNEKSTSVAWKFLLLNSFGMGIAFLGLIIISFGVHTIVTMNIQSILQNVPNNQNILVEIGIWLVVFGYSTKLGLVPNHYWVSDTYSESPSQISALFASIIPVTMSIALRPIVHMDMLIHHSHFSSRHGLLVMGILTMIYSILTLYQATDLRRITSLIALFHNGAIGVFLWLNTPDEVFYLAMTSLIVIKALIFGTMGTLRLDLSSRFIDKIPPDEGLHPLTRFLYLASIFMAFSVPISPMFLSDMMAMRMAVKHSYYWYVLVPCLGISFFSILLYKVLPIVNIHSRDFREQNKREIRIRILLTIIVFIISILIALFGFYNFSTGGLGDV